MSLLSLSIWSIFLAGWVKSQGGHSEQLSFSALFYQSTPSCLKVLGGMVGWVGGPCDYCVRPSPFGLHFGTLDLGLRTSDLGLTIGKCLLCLCSLKTHFYCQLVAISLSWHYNLIDTFLKSIHGRVPKGTLPDPWPRDHFICWSGRKTLMFFSPSYVDLVYGLVIWTEFDIVVRLV